MSAFPEPRDEDTQHSGLHSQPALDASGPIPKATKGVVNALRPETIGRIVKGMGPGLTSRILGVLGEWDHNCCWCLGIKNCQHNKNPAAAVLQLHCLQTHGGA